MSEFIEALIIIAIVAIAAMVLGKDFKGKISKDSGVDMSISEKEDKKNK